MNDPIVREIMETELVELLELYTHLHNNGMPEIEERTEQLWQKIMDDENHHVIVVMVDGMIISSCILIIIPNLTHAQRPFAIIENVITHPEFRKKGYATNALNYAKDMAIDNDCYKMMLLTGSKEESTLHFYEEAGYNRHDKTAFIQWLK